MDESCAYAVWDNEEEVDGIIAISEAFAFHLEQKNEEVLLAICRCVQALCEHEDVAEHLVANSVTEQLTRAKLLCNSNSNGGSYADILTACTASLEILVGNA